MGIERAASNRKTERTFREREAEEKKKRERRGAEMERKREREREIEIEIEIEREGAEIVKKLRAALPKSALTHQFKHQKPWTCINNQKRFRNHR